MSSTQENLLFKITVEQTGLTSPQIDSLTKSLQGLGNVLKGSTGSSGLTTSLEGINAEAKTLMGTVTTLNSKLSQLGGGSASAGLKQIKADMQSTTQSIQQGTRQADSAFATFKTAVKGASDQLGIYKNAATTASSASNTLTASQERLATFNMNVQKTFTTASEATMVYGRQVEAAAASTRTFDTAANRTSADLQRLTSATETANIAQNTGVGYDKERAQSLMNNVRHISGTALSFMSLSQAMDSVNGIGEMVAMQQEKVNQAHQKVVETLAKYGSASKQYQQAVAQEQKAIRGMNYEQREANFALHNLMFMIGLVAIELTNSLLPVMIKVIAKIKEMGGVSAVATMAFNKIADAAGLMGTAVGLGGGKTSKALTEVEQAATKGGKGTVSALDMMKTAAANVLGSVIPLSWGKGKVAVSEFVAEHEKQAAKFGGVLSNMGSVSKNIMEGIITTAASTIGLLPLEFSKGAKGPATLLEQSRGPLKNFENITKSADTTSKSAMGNIEKYAVEAATNVAGAAPQLGKFGGEAEKLGPKALQAAEGASKLGLASQIMSVLVKTGWGALIAAAAGLILYGTNTFGARDAVNAFGVSIGKTNPIIKTMGDFAVGLAGQLGITGETAVQTQKHIDDLGKDFDVLAGLWNDAVAGMQRSDNVLVRDVGNTIVNVNNAFTKMGGDFANQVQASITTWQKFTDALEKHDYKTAVDMIGQAFAALPGILNQIVTDVGTMWADVQKGINKFLSDVGTGLTKWGSETLAGITKWGTDVGNAIKGGFEAVVGITTEVMGRVIKALNLDPQVQLMIKGIDTIKTAFTNIVQPILGAITQITNALKPLLDMIGGAGKAIQGGLGAIGNAFGMGNQPQGNGLGDWAGPLTNAQKDQQKVLDQQKAALQNPIQLPGGGTGAGTSTRNDKAVIGDQIGEPGYKFSAFGGSPYGEGVTFAADRTGGPEAGPGVSEDVKRGRAALGEENLGAPQLSTKAEDAAAAQAKQQKATQPKSNPNLITPEMTDEPAISKETNAAYKELTGTVDKLYGSYKNYDDILTTTKGVSELQRKGTLEQQTAYQGMQADLISSTAANAEYAKQLADGGIQQTAFDQGIQDTDKELMDQQVALANSQGAHKRMAEQMVAGVPQMNAFNKGMDDQVGALQEQQIATAGTTGTYLQLESQMANGTAQLAAMDQGFADTTLAIDQQEVAVANTTGSLNAYEAAIGSGQMETIAFGEGVNTARKNLVDSYVTMNQTVGTLQEFGLQLQTNIPQAIAFSQGLLDTRMAAAKLQTDVANLHGTVQGLFDNLKNGQTVLLEQQKAFTEGGIAAAQWGMQLLTADSSQRGLTQGLQEVGDALGVQTEGFVGSTDELKTWIGIMKGVGTVIDEAASKMYQEGVSMMSDLNKAIADGGKGLKDAFKGIEDAIGTDLPKGIKNALEQASIGQVYSDEIKKMLALGMVAISQDPSPEAMGKLVDKMGEKFQSEMDAMSPTVKAKVQGVIDQINTLLTQGPPPGENGFKVWAVTMNALMNQVQAAADPTKQKLDGIAGIKFSEQPVQAWTTLIAKMKDNQPLTDAETKMKAAAESAGLLGPAGTTAAGGLDTATTATGQLGTATTTANTTLTTFTTTMGTMASVVQQVLANIVTQFQTTFTTITGVISTFFQTIVSMVAPNMALFVTELAPIVPAWQLVFDTIVAATTTFFQTLTSMVAPNMLLFVEAAQPTIPGFQLIFDTITQNIQTTFQQWVQATQQVVQQITTEVQALVGVFNDTFKRAVEDAAGYLIKLQQANTKTFQDITKTVQEVVGVFNDNFKRATSDAEGYIKELGQIAAQVMQQIEQKAAQAAKGLDKIGQSAQQAAGEVRKLRSEIDALHDKTVTITIRTVRVGGGMAAAEGMPPTLYMAGGGSGIAQTNVYGDKPGNKNQRVIVGESGDEMVTRTGLKSKKSTVEEVRHIKYIKGLGQDEPEMLTVVPLEGTNAMMFQNKHPELFASGIYNAGSYPGYQQTTPSLPMQQQLPSTYSQMVYGRLIKDKHGNVTLNGRLVFRAGEALDIDAYEGRHISHGSHGDPDDRRHFQNIAGSNEDIKHNGVPFSFGSLTGFGIQSGMTTGIGKSRGLGVGGAMGMGVGALGGKLDAVPSGPIDIDTIPSASTDRLQASQRLYNDYISERVAAARDRPRTQQQDAVNGNIDNQADPSQIEYNEGAVLPSSQMDSVPPRLLPHHRQGPSAAQRSYEEDYTAFMQKLIAEITKKVDGKIRINLHSQVDTRIWGKITNQQVLNDMVRS